MKIRMQRFVFAGATVLMLAVGFFIIYSYSSGAQSSVFSISNSYIKSLAMSVVDKVKAYLEPAEKTNADLSFLFRTKKEFRISEGQETTLGFFKEVLRANPEYVMVYFADTKGNLIMARRMPDGTLSKRYVTREANGVRVHYVHESTRSALDLPDTFSSLETGYDPRQRPWYKLAVERHAMCWTDVYLFATDKMPGFSCANPVYDSDGNLVGVTCVDIGIKEISAFLSGLNLSPNAEVRVIDGAQRVVAKLLQKGESIDSLFMDAPGGNGDKQLLTVSDYKDPAFQEAFKTRLSQDPSDEPRAFSAAGTNYHAALAMLVSGHGLNLDVSVIVPDGDFLGVVYHNNFVILVVSILFIVALLVGSMFILFYTERSNNRLASKNQDIEHKLRVYERIIALTPDMITLIDAEANFIVVNDAYLATYGKKREELEGKNLRDLIGTSTFEKFTRPNMERVLRGELVNYNVMISPGDGRSIWANITNSPFTDEHGNIVGIVASIRDISANKKIQDELAQSELRYRRLVEMSPDAVVIHAGGIVRYANPACLRLIGGEGAVESEFVGKNVFEFIHPDFHAMVKSRMGRVYEEQKANEFTECRFVRSNGECFDGIAASVPTEVGGELAVQTVFMDISERKKAEDALKASQQRMFDIIDFLPDATFVIDKEGRVTAWNKAIEKLTGVLAKDMIGKGNHEYAIPFYGKRQDILIDLVHTPEGELREKYSHISKEGNTIVAETYVPSIRGRQHYLFGAATALYDEQGRPVGAIESIRDRTERKLQDDMVVFQKALLEAQNESSLDGILVVANDGRVVSWNQRFADMWSISAEVMEKNSDSAIIEELLRKVNDPGAFIARVEELYARPEDSSRDVIILTGGGILDRYTAPIRGEDGTYYGRVWFFRDITDWKIAEEELKLKEREITRVNRFSDTALDLSRSGYWYIDFKNPEYMVLSERVAQISGEFPDSDKRLHLREQFLARIAANDPAKAKDVYEAFHGALEGRYPRYEETYALRKPSNGELVWIHAVGELVRNPDGTPSMMFGVAQDVTAQKNLEKEIRTTNELLTFILNTSPIAIGIATKGNIIFLNRTFEEIFGLKTGESMRELWVDPEVRAELLEAVEKEGFVSDREIRMWDKNHVERDILAALYKMSFDGEPSILIWLTDISYLKELNVELVRSRDEAQTATRAKSDFLARMSHEIRTPMNAIIGLSHLALQTELSAKQEDYLSKTLASAQNLLKIINDILDFSKIEAGRLELEHINFELDTVIENVTNQTAINASEKGLELLFSIDHDVPIALRGDQLRLGQILLNLVSNAVKFTTWGEIVVHVSLVERSGDSCLIGFSVRDTGIGLREDQIAELFKPFTQADISTTRKYGGTGLGLTICQRLAEMLGGSIGVESVPDKGSTFSFTARFEIQAETPQKRKALPEDLEKLSVLVVDDNATSRGILKDQLENFAWDVHSAASGQEAIECIEERQKISDKTFDLILMDWKMPGMDGIETSKRIKHDLNLHSMPTIIMITAHGREEVLKQAKEAKLDGFLVKPVSSSVLLDTIMEAFGKQIEKRSYLDRPLEHRPKGFDQVRGAKILLVEDNEVNRQVATDLLNREGFWVKCANDGLEAITLVHASADDSFDLILMDLQMPVMDGYTATVEIRRMKGPSIPIIAMTADAMSGVAERCLEIGMNDYVSKPIDPADLFRALAKWIKPGKRELFTQVEDASPTQHVALAPMYGIDQAAGLERAGGKRSFYASLLKRFAEGQTSVDRDIDAALAKGDVILAVRLAHTLKGVAGNIGAVALQAHAAIYEKALKNGDMDGIRAEKPLFAAELARVCEGITQGLAEPTEAKPKAQEKRRAKKSIKRIAAELGELEGLLAEDDSEATEFFDKHAQIFSDEMKKADFEALRTWIHNYEFDSALERVRLLLKK